MECKSQFAEIVVGSKAEFDLVLSDGGRPLNLSPYTGGNLVFLNCNGVRTVVALPIPGVSPANGIVATVVSSVQSANADEKWKDADLELIAPSAANNKVIPLYDKFKIIKRNAPPTV